MKRALNYNSLTDPNLVNYFEKIYSRNNETFQTNKHTKSKFCNQHLINQLKRFNRNNKYNLKKKKFNKNIFIKNVITYKLNIVTGLKRNSTSNSWIYVTLYGSKGTLHRIRINGIQDNILYHSPKTLTEVDPILRETDMSLIVKKFKRGTAKCIYITATDIGKLLYIELEIYNKNINKPIKWYADSITIQLSNSKNLLHFDCKSWLSNCIADCVQIKTFYPIQYRHTVYQIKTKTGNTKGSGTIGNVFITLYGESCETAKFPLTNKSNNIFNSEEIDTFYFKSICIGPLVKIKIELIPKSKNKERNSWNLLKVNVDDLINKKWNSEFPCNEFLQVNCRKQIVEKILYSNKSFQIDRKKTKYEIEVFTGKNGYTNSNVFINIYGSLGKTGPYYLNTNANNFKSDSMDIFIIETYSIGLMTKIHVGIDGSGSFSEWFLKKININDKLNKLYFTFKANRWFSLTKDSASLTGYIQGTKLALNDEFIIKTEYKWNLRLVTVKQTNTNTKANVWLYLYGKKQCNHYARSEKIALKKHKDRGFHSGTTYVVQIETKNIGDIYKICIYSDALALENAWYLESIHLYLSNNNKRYDFFLKKWIGNQFRLNDQYRNTREVICANEIKEKIQQYQYILHIKTGNKIGSSTNSNVYIQIYGIRGDSGPRKLSLSVNNGKNIFEKDCIDEFRLKVVDLIKIVKIKIWTDELNIGSNWYLEYVDIKCDKTNEFCKFECNRWFSSKMEDGQINRTFYYIKSPLLASTRYIFLIKTGDMFGAGTDGNISIQLNGEYCNTLKFRLYKSFTKSCLIKNKFERSSLERFEMEHDFVGNIYKAKLFKETNLTAMEDWYVEYVQIIVPSSGKIYTFNINSWFNKSSKNMPRLFLFDPKIESINKMIPYQITIFTGNQNNADTKSNVCIQLYGLYGKSENVLLPRNNATFQVGSKDVFKIESVNIGPIVKCRVGFDRNNKKSTSWYLEKVLVQSIASNQLKSSPKRISKTHQISKSHIDTIILSIPFKNPNTHNFLANDDNCEKKNLKNVTKKLSRYSTRGASKYINKNKLKNVKQECNCVVDLLNDDIDNVLFMSNRWLYSNESEMANNNNLKNCDFEMVELLPYNFIMDKTPNLEKSKYEIIIKTGDKRFAGTNANVFIQLFGIMGDSGQISLKNSLAYKKPFERNQSDIFELNILDLGTLAKVRIRHDNSHLSSDWYLEFVKVVNKSSNTSVIFPCHRWISNKIGYKQICIELIPTDEKAAKRKDSLTFERKNILTTYLIKVATGNVWGAGTDSNIHIVLYGTKDDSGIINLKNSETHKNKFERGTIDKFSVELYEIGSIEKILIGQDNSGVAPTWFLNYIEIESPALGKYWKFPYHDWLSEKNSYGNIEQIIYLQVSQSKNYKPKVPYEIKVSTSSNITAGSNANIFINVFSAKYETGEHFLNVSDVEKSNFFNRGSQDRFILEMPDICDDKIEMIRIGHRSKSLGSGWHCKDVTLRRLAKSDSVSVTFIFNVNRWFAVDEENGNTIRDILPNRVECESLIMKGNELVPSITNKEISNKSKIKISTYIVTIFCGDQKYSQTTSIPFIEIIGGSSPLSSTGSRPLTSKKSKKNVSTYHVEAIYVDNIQCIKLSHDNSGSKGISDGWFVDRVDIKVIKNKSKNEKKKNYTFSLNEWINVKTGLCKTLYPS